KDLGARRDPVGDSDRRRRRPGAEAQPWAPLRAIVGANPELIGCGATYIESLRELRRGDVDLDVRSLAHPVDDKVPVSARIPQCIFDDRITVRVARRKQAGNRDSSAIRDPGVRDSYDWRGRAGREALPGAP